MADYAALKGKIEMAVGYLTEATKEGCGKELADSLSRLALKALTNGAAS